MYIKHKAPCYDVRYCLLLTVLAQSSSSPTLAGIGATVSTLIWTIGCFACCWCFLKKFLRHSQPASHANRPRPQRSFPSPVIYYQNSQKGVTPSRGNAVSYIPPSASTFACPQAPINRLLALQYECSGHTPPPYLSLPPPYTALQSQHSHVLTIDSGGWSTGPVLHVGSDSEVQNEVESGAEVLAQPLLHVGYDSEVELTRPWPNLLLFCLSFLLNFFRLPILLPIVPILLLSHPFCLSSRVMLLMNDGCLNFDLVNSVSRRHTWHQSGMQLVAI